MGKNQKFTQGQENPTKIYAKSIICDLKHPYSPSRYFTFLP